MNVEPNYGHYGDHTSNKLNVLKFHPNNLFLWDGAFQRIIRAFASHS